MALDLRYVLAYTFGKYFVDKDTGAPLSAGYIQFFRDIARTVPKDVFIISGSPPNYTYTNIGSVVNLNSTGMPEYLGENIAIYFFPYLDDGVTLDLYFYKVYSAGNIFQFSREGQPNLAQSGNNTTVELNFVPNGQFLLHNDLPATDIPPLYQTGEIRQAVTEIAQGGWTFERPNASSSKDIVTFPAFQTFISTPPPDSNPRFSIEIVNEIPDAGDTIKDLRLKFDDVNKFGSSTNEIFTYAFTGQSNTGGTQNVSLFLIKNYGTNGSPTVEIPLGVITLQPTWTRESISFTFGNNIGETISSDNTDFLQLAIRFPLTTVFDVSFTDFILAEGQLNLPDFPTTTDSQFSDHSTTVPVPNPAGYDLFLTRKSNLNGDFYDHSEIGDVVGESGLPINYNLSTGFHNFSNRLMAMGQQFETTSYSPLGIPMLRLQQQYFDSTIQTPIYGTGLSFATAYYPTGGTQLILANNSAGAVANIVDTGATGFTFATIHTGTATLNVNSYYAKAYMTDIPSVVTDPATFWIELYYYQNTNLSILDINAQNSGFTVGTIQHMFDATDLKKIDFVTVSAVPIAGHYFTFSSISATNTQLKFYVWFKVDGAGVDPAPATYTGIEVDLLSTDTPTIVAEKIRESLNGWQVSTIIVPATPPVSSYFEFTTISPTGATQLYVVWYKINGAGVKPVVANAIYIEVDILSTDSNAAIASKTQAAINSRYFAIPDYRDVFIRGWNNGKITDQDVSQRWSLVPGVIGDMVGTYQNSDNLDHVHNGGSSPIPALDGITNNNDNIGTGHIHDYQFHHFESRPINFFVNYVIKY